MAVACWRLPRVHVSLLPKPLLVPPVVFHLAIRFSHFVERQAQISQFPRGIVFQINRFCLQLACSIEIAVRACAAANVG